MWINISEIIDKIIIIIKGIDNWKKLIALAVILVFVAFLVFILNPTPDCKIRISNLSQSGEIVENNTISDGSVMIRGHASDCPSTVTYAVVFQDWAGKYYSQRPINLSNIENWSDTFYLGPSWKGKDAILHLISYPTNFNWKTSSDGDFMRLTLPQGYKSFVQKQLIVK